MADGNTTDALLERGVVKESGVEIYKPRGKITLSTLRPQSRRKLGHAISHKKSHTMKKLATTFFKCNQTHTTYTPNAYANITHNDQRTVHIHTW